MTKSLRGRKGVGGGGGGLWLNGSREWNTRSSAFHPGMARGELDSWFRGGGGKEKRGGGKIFGTAFERDGMGREKGREGGRFRSRGEF